MMYGISEIWMHTNRIESLNSLLVINVVEMITFSFTLQRLRALDILNADSDGWNDFIDECEKRWTKYDLDHFAVRVVYCVSEHYLPFPFPKWWSFS